MLQASLPECSQEAYRGFTGSHLLALNTLAKHIHIIVSQLTLVTICMTGLWQGN